MAVCYRPSVALYTGQMLTKYVTSNWMGQCVLQLHVLCLCPIPIFSLCVFSALCLPLLHLHAGRLRRLETETFRDTHTQAADVWRAQLLLKDRLPFLQPRPSSCLTRGCLQQHGTWASFFSSPKPPALGMQAAGSPAGPKPWLGGQSGLLPTPGQVASPCNP